MNDLELVENKDLRVAKLDRIEVLDRVGGLILLPNVDVALQNNWLIILTLDNKL